MPAYELNIASFSQLGRRTNQEDAVLTDDRQRLYMVCDGVGGNSNGEQASSAVCRLVDQAVAAWQGKLCSDIKPSAVADMTDSVCQQLETEDIGDGATTLTMLRWADDGALAVHVGDSRIYQFRRGQGKVFRSRDHSLVQDMVEVGMLTDDEARTHPRSNIITQAMHCVDSDRTAPKPSVTHISDIRPGDVFLLCSDGVWGEMSDDELWSFFEGSDTLDSKMARLAERTKNSHDNNSAVAVEVAGAVGIGNSCAVGVENSCAYATGGCEENATLLQRIRKSLACAFGLRRE